MPFAIGVALLASREATLTVTAFVLIGVHGQRWSVAMGFNRRDRDIDAINQGQRIGRFPLENSFELPQRTSSEAR